MHPSLQDTSHERWSHRVRATLFQVVTAWYIFVFGGACLSKHLVGQTLYTPLCSAGHRGAAPSELK